MKIRMSVMIMVSCLVAILFSGCTRATEKYSKNGTYFDTVITITVYDPKQVDLIEDCFDMAAHYEQLFSRTISTSDISRINDAGGEYVTVDTETVDLIERGLYYCELSEGSFDITVGVLSDLWHFSDNEGVLPDETAIAEAVQNVDYHDVQIKGDQVALLNPKAKLDLGGIAKGYIADQMKTYLVEQGVKSATINLGGNVLTIGTKPDGTPFHIGIQKPYDDRGASIAAVSVTDQSVVSSGTYERYFDLDGVHYHHILDTKTGYPYDNGLLGVTILSDSSTDGDGLSTTCFTLGLEKGMELIESLDGVEALFMTEDYEFYTTGGLEDKLELVE